MNQTTRSRYGSLLNTGASSSFRGLGLAWVQNGSATRLVAEKLNREQMKRLNPYLGMRAALDAPSNLSYSILLVHNLRMFPPLDILFVWKCYWLDFSQR